MWRCNTRKGAGDLAWPGAPADGGHGLAGRFNGVVINGLVSARDYPIRRNTVLLAAALTTLSGMIQLAVAVETTTLVLVTGAEGILGPGPATFPASGPLAALPAGRAMDRFGRVRVIAAGFVIGIVACVVTALGCLWVSGTLVALGFALVGAAQGTIILARAAAATPAPLAEILRRPGAKPALLAALASFAVMVAVMNLSGYIVVDHGHSQADTFSVISAHIVGMYGLVLFVGDLIDRMGRRIALVGGLLVMGVSCVALAWIDDVLSMSLALFGLGLGWVFSYV